MRIDPDECRDPDLLAAEVRRLQAVIAASAPTLTDEERKAVEWSIADQIEGGHQDHLVVKEIIATLRNLLEKTK
jgi:hypothetical protein